MFNTNNTVNEKIKDIVDTFKTSVSINNVRDGRHYILDEDNDNEIRELLTEYFSNLGYNVSYNEDTKTLTVEDSDSNIIKRHLYLNVIKELVDDTNKDENGNITLHSNKLNVDIITYSTFRTIASLFTMLYSNMDKEITLTVISDGRKEFIFSHVNKEESSKDFEALVDLSNSKTTLSSDLYGTVLTLIDPCLANDGDNYKYHIIEVEKLHLLNDALNKYNSLYELLKQYIAIDTYDNIHEVKYILEDDNIYKVLAL